VSAKTLMGRLEQQSGQLAVVQAELDETKRALDNQREEAALLREAFEAERAARKRVEGQLAREQEARREADRGADHAHATTNALEGQLAFLRAQLKAQERKPGRRHRLAVPWLHPR
jgi:chromosome segregation ATPase